MTDRTKAMDDLIAQDADLIDSQSQHCPNCEAQAAEIKRLRKEVKSEQKQSDSVLDNYDAMERRIEAAAAEERAAIVDYARGHGGNAWSRDVLYFADKIEAKEHLK